MPTLQELLAEDQLFPKVVRDILPPLYSQEDVADPQVVLKFFNPTGGETWYIIEGSPVDENGSMIEPDALQDEQDKAVDFLFFSWVSGVDFPELGYVSLTELRLVRLFGGLKIERDEWFKPCPLSEVKAEYGE